MSTAPIVQKVWNFCTTLRDGVGYGDYLEQITYLIFLKMADEYARPPYSRNVGVPPAHAWPRLRADRRGAGGSLHRDASRAGNAIGHVGPDFHQGAKQDSRPRQTRPPRRPDRREENWAMLKAPTSKGRHLRRPAGAQRQGHEIGRRPIFHPARADPRHGRLRRAGAQQNHRRPRLPGTGGFFLLTYDFLSRQKLDKGAKVLPQTSHFLRQIVANTRRLCLMNIFLHNIGEMDGQKPRYKA